MAEKSNYLKSGFWYIIGNILVKGISFLALPIFTRLLSPADFGKFNIFLAYENILYIVLGLGLAGTIKTAYFDFREKFDEYFSAILSLTFLTTIVIDFLVNGVVLLWHPLHDEFWNQGMINILIFHALATALFTLMSTKFVIEVQYKQNLFYSLLYTISSVLLSIVLCFVLFSAERYLARILGNAIPLMLITYIYCISYIFRKKKFIFIDYWKYGLKMGIPLIFHSLSMVLLQQLDKIMVKYFCGVSQAGIYSLAVTITVVVTTILGSLDNAWAPWFYRKLDEEKSDELIAGNKKIAASFALFVGAVMLGAPEILRIMATEQYKDAVFCLIPLILSDFCSLMYIFYVNQEYFHKKTNVIAVGTILATAVDFALNMLLIPAMGFVAAAYTTLISKLVLFVLHYYMVKRLKGIKAVNVKTLWLLFGCLSVIAAVSLWFRDAWYIRYAVLCIILVCACKTIYKWMIEYRNPGKSYTV